MNGYDGEGYWEHHTDVYCGRCGREVSFEGLCPVCDDELQPGDDGYELGFSTHSFDDVTTPYPSEDEDHDHE